MKNIVKQIALAVVIATAATSAQAGIQEIIATTANYWKRNVAHAAQTMKAMPKTVSNWFARNYFFAINSHKLSAVLNKLDNFDPINRTECEIAYNAIEHSTLSEDLKRTYGDALTQYMHKNENNPEIVAARDALINIKKQQQKNLAIYTASTLTGIAAIVAYKRYTARPSIPGWCS